MYVFIYSFFFFSVFIYSVSEIKLLDCAPAGGTSHETVHPGTSPCTLLICSNDKWLIRVHTFENRAPGPENVHTGCRVHA